LQVERFESCKVINRQTFQLSNLQAHDLTMRKILRRENPKGSGRSDSPGAQVDRELAARIGKGDREALERLLDRHLDPVYAYIRRRLGPDHDELAAQVVTATFEQALRRMGPYARGTASTPMRLWLFKLAGNHLASRRFWILDFGFWSRSVNPKSKIRVPSGRPKSIMALRESIAALPPRKQAVLSLALFEELVAEELAAAAGVSVPRAMRLLRSALRSLG
jgi:DNA-directed RNA polymerase specialized sigma24 family protein